MVPLPGAIQSNGAATLTASGADAPHGPESPDQFLGQFADWIALPVSAIQHLASFNFHRNAPSITRRHPSGA